MQNVQLFVENHLVAPIETLSIYIFGFIYINALDLPFMFQWDLITDQYIDEIFHFPITRYKLNANDMIICPLSDQYLELFQLVSENLLISPLYIHGHFELLVSTISRLSDFSSGTIVNFIRALLQSTTVIYEQISWMLDNIAAVIFTDKQIAIVSCTLKKMIYVISEIFVKTFRSCPPSNCSGKVIFETDFETFDYYFGLVNRLLSGKIELLFCSLKHGSISDTVLYLMIPSFLIINLPVLLKRLSQAFIQSIYTCLDKYPCLLIETGIKISESLLCLQPSVHFQHLQQDILFLFEELIPRVPSLGLQIIREFILKLQPKNNLFIVRILGPVLSIVASKCNFHVEEILHLIIPLLDADCYLVRNLSLSTLTDILSLKVPTNSLSTDSCIFTSKSHCNHIYSLFENLTDHILDTNAFVRTRCIFLLSSLWESDSIPLNRKSYFLEKLVGRIFDNSVLVRKQTFISLTSILRKNPFNSEVLQLQPFQLTLERELSILLSIEADYYDRFFHLETIDTALHTEIEDLLQSTDEIAVFNCDPQEENCLYDKIISEIRIGYVGDCIAAFDWLKRHKPNHLVFRNPAGDVTPVILGLSIHDLLTLSTIIRINRKLDYCKDNISILDLQIQKVNFLRSAIGFIDLLYHVLPSALTILQSNQSSDVLSSLIFLREYINYKLPDYLTCIDPIMSLIWSQHVSHREYALKTFVEHFGFSFGMQNSIISRYTALIQKVSDKIYSHLSYMAFYSIQCILSSLAQQGNFPSDFITVLLQISTQNPYSISSNLVRNNLMIICMIAKELDVILYDNYELIVSVCFTKNLMNLEVARLGCSALNIMCSMRKLSSIQFSRLKISHPIFKSIELFMSSKLCDTDVDWSSFIFDSLLLTLGHSRAPFMLLKNYISTCTSIINVIVDERKKIIGISRVFILIGRVAQLFILLIEEKLSDPVFESFNSFSEYVNELNLLNLDHSYSLFASNPDISTSGIRSKSMLSRYTYLLTHVLQSSIFVEFSSLFMNVSDISISFILQLQCSAIFALSQLMMVSIQFCERNIKLIISLMTTHRSQFIRKSCLFVVSDLIMRYPNTLQPWIPYIFRILRDPCALVRKQALLVLSHLIIIDIVKIQGFIAEIAYLIEDNNSSISEIAIGFFSSISKDGNILYNTLPDIISHMLDQDNNNLGINSIENILCILFSYVKKEKQIDKLVEKLISRFKSTKNSQQREVIAYSLSLLPQSERTLIYLVSQSSTLRLVIQDENIRSHFLVISKEFHKLIKVFPEMGDLLSQFDILLQNIEI